MDDPKDQMITRLRSSLRLALSLMTQYQRERYNKLSQRYVRETQEKSVFRKGGRPRAFKGYLNSTEKPVQSVPNPEA